MKRREFITLLGGGAAAWPLAARAQQPTKSRKVGLLHQGESTVVNMRVAAVREGLNGPESQADLSLEIVVRLADGDVSRLPALATDLVNNRVDAIVAAAPAAVQAASGATTSIPVIAIDLESDPVASGFVRSLARPGGNVTGVFLDFPDKASELMRRNDLPLCAKAVVTRRSKTAVLGECVRGFVAIRYREAWMLPSSPCLRDNKCRARYRRTHGMAGSELPIGENSPDREKNGGVD